MSVSAMANHGLEQGAGHHSLLAPCTMSMLPTLALTVSIHPPRLGYMCEKRAFMSYFASPRDGD